MEKMIDINAVEMPETLENTGDYGIIDIVDKAFVELAQVREKISELEKIKKHFEGIIKEAMDSTGAETMERNGYKAYYQAVQSNKWDSDRLKADHPEIEQEYFIKGAAIRFQFRKVKGA